MVYHAGGAFHGLGDNGMGRKTSRLTRVLSGGAFQLNSLQIELGGLANPWSGYATAYQHFDAYAIAPYYGYPVPDSWSADGTGLTNVFTEMDSGGALPSTSGANTTTNVSNAYSLTSSSACGNGAIPSTPSNETMTCFKANAASLRPTNIGRGWWNGISGLSNQLWQLCLEFGAQWNLHCFIYDANGSFALGFRDRLF